MYTCVACGLTKSPGEFYASNKARCKECKKLYAKQKYESDPEAFKARRKAYVANNPEKVRATNSAWQEANPDKAYLMQRKKTWRYRGITDVDTLDWEELIESQSGKCLVCGAAITPRTAVRDHDHETGLTRGAVCGTECNIAMDRL